MEASQAEDAPYQGQYVAGFQWHPEFAANELDCAILANFVEVARANVRTKQAEKIDEAYKNILPKYLQQIAEMPTNEISGFFDNAQWIPPQPTHTLAMSF